MSEKREINRGADARMKISFPQHAPAPKQNAAGAKPVRSLAKCLRFAGLLQGYFHPG